MINGAIAFGKFRPYEGSSVSTLVDIEGKDLASVTLYHVDSMTIEDIREAIKGRVKEIKSKGGDS